MSHDEKLTMISRMQKYGGSFVQALAVCFVRADHINTLKLSEAFPEYVRQYTEDWKGP